MSTTLLTRVALVAFFNVLVRSGNSNCLSGWRQFRCSCYSFGTKETVNWKTAIDRCKRNHDSHLVTISSMEENNFVGKHLIEKSWLGLRKQGSSFQLVDEGTASYFAWEGKTPTFGNRTCVVARPGRATVWATRKCSQKFKYICEKQSLEEYNTCRKEWKKFNGSCYRLSKSVSTFKDAREQCRNLNSSLAEISTRQENDFVRLNLTSNISEVAWFGLEKPMNSTMFKYSKSVPNYKSIGVDQLKSNYRTRSCVTLSLGTKNTVWIPSSCNNMSTYSCETEIMNRTFQITALNVNETYANISWKINQSRCDKLSPNAKYKLLLKQNGSVILNKMVYNASSTIAIGILRPATKYEVALAEIFKTNVSSPLHWKPFRTAKIGNPLKVITSLSSSSIKAKQGDSVSLICTAQGELPVKFSWKKDNKSLSSLEGLNSSNHFSILIIKLVNKGSFGKYTCHIRDRFSNKYHSISVDNLSTGNREEQFFIATITLVALLFTLILVVVFFICKSNKKGSKTKFKKSDFNLSEKRKDETDENKSKDENPSTARDSTPDVRQTEFSTYTSLQRPNDETDENVYCNLNSSLYENPLDIDV